VLFRSQQETNYQGLAYTDRIIKHNSSAVPVKFYEAVPTTTIDVSVSVTGFTGSVTVEATKNIVTGHEAFLHPITIQTQTFTVSRSTPVLFTDIDITDYTYIRVSYINTTGTVDFFTVASSNKAYEPYRRHTTSLLTSQAKTHP
jgi:hypothetical protein